MPPTKPFNYLYAIHSSHQKLAMVLAILIGTRMLLQSWPNMKYRQLPVLSRKDQSFKVAPCMKSLSMCYRKICALSKSSSQVEPYFMFTLLLRAVSSFTQHKILLIYMQRFQPIPKFWDLKLCLLLLYICKYLLVFIFPNGMVLVQMIFIFKWYIIMLFFIKRTRV